MARRSARFAALHRGLSQQVLAAGEGTEQLVVEVVAVGQHDDGGVVHRRFPDDAPGIEGHGQALARPLRVPDDADTPVARFAARLSAGFVTARRLGNARHFPLQLRSTQSLGDGRLHCVELVVARHLLHQGAAAVVLEYDEVAQQCQEAVGFTDAFKHHLQLRHIRVGQRLARDGAPGLEPLPPGCQGTDAGIEPVRHHERDVEGEQRGDFGLVGLQLLPGGPDGGLFIDRVLQLDDRQRQPVDEQHHVGAALVPVLDDGELVDRQPVVVGRVVEVDDTRLVAAHRAVGVAVFHRHAVHGHAMEGAVAGFQRGSLRVGQLAEGVVQGIGRKIGVEAGEGIAETLGQYDIAVIGALSVRRAGRDVRAVGHTPAEVVQPSQGRLLDIAFGEGGHGASQGLKTSTSRRPKSAALRVATARSWALAIPATKASAMSTVCPERRAFARNSAAHSAPALSNGST